MRAEGFQKLVDNRFQQLKVFAPVPVDNLSALGQLDLQRFHQVRIRRLCLQCLVALLQCPAVKLPGPYQARFHVKRSPVQEPAPLLRGPVDQGMAARFQHHRGQVGPEIRQAASILTVDAAGPAIAAPLDAQLVGSLVLIQGSGKDLQLVGFRPHQA